MISEILPILPLFLSGSGNPASILHRRFTSFQTSTFPGPHAAATQHNTDQRKVSPLFLGPLECLKLSTHSGSRPTPLRGLVCRRHLPTVPPHGEGQERIQHRIQLVLNRAQLCVRLWSILCSALPLLGTHWVPI